MNGAKPIKKTYLIEMPNGWREREMWSKIKKKCEISVLSRTIVIEISRQCAIKMISNSFDFPFFARSLTIPRSSGSFSFYYFIISYSTSRRSDYACVQSKVMRREWLGIMSPHDCWLLSTNSLAITSYWHCSCTKTKWEISGASERESDMCVHQVVNRRK